MLFGHGSPSMKRSRTRQLRFNIAPERAQRSLAHEMEAAWQSLAGMRASESRMAIQAALLAAMALPALVRSRDNSRLNYIYSNLRSIETAKEQWALDNKKTNGDPVDLTLLGVYLHGGTVRDAIRETYVSRVTFVPPSQIRVNTHTHTQKKRHV